MALLKGKHQVAEIDGVRCSVIETGLDPKRMEFLKEILTFNGYEVMTEPEKAKDGTPTGSYQMGVTDLLMNPVVKLYQKKLFRKDGAVINPAYWYQWPNQWDTPYWQVQR